MHPPASKNKGYSRRRGPPGLKHRFCYALTIAVTALLFLDALHDYPRMQHAAAEVRIGHFQGRAWLPMFYFVNEAGDGLRYAFTGDRRYMAHFPSERYQEADACQAENAAPC